MADGIVIRDVGPEERARYARAVFHGFNDQPTDEGVEAESRFAAVGRAVAARDGASMVGTALWFPTRLTMPGGRDLAASALTEVTVLPTHRRRGVMRAMLLEMFAEIRGAAVPVSVLTASEGAIYGRFGYGPATTKVRYRLPRHGAALRDGQGPSTGMRLVGREEAEPHLVRLHEAHRRRGAGDIHRPAEWWGWTLGDVGGRLEGLPGLFFALRDGARGRPDAGVVYRVVENERVQVEDVVAAGAAAEREAWRYLLGIDLPDEVRFRGAPDHPLHHMLANHRRLAVDSQEDGLWVRVLDVPAALTGRAYRAAGEAVLEVVDPLFPEVGGRFALAAGPDGAQCARTRRRPDVSMDVSALGQVLLGNTSVAALARAGRVQARDAARADVLLAHTPLPYLDTRF